ncbi:MAG: hypothetical protein PHF97_10970, partial [Bacteroidales bacterium]|nr:hypothetical protein [Bacteroidales bacterium]
MALNLPGSTSGLQWWKTCCLSAQSGSPENPIADLFASVQIFYFMVPFSFDFLGNHPEKKINFTRFFTFVLSFYKKKKKYLFRSHTEYQTANKGTKILN